MSPLCAWASNTCPARPTCGDSPEDQHYKKLSQWENCIWPHQFFKSNLGVWTIGFCAPIWKLASLVCAEEIRLLPLVISWKSYLALFIASSEQYQVASAGAHVKGTCFPAQVECGSNQMCYCILQICWCSLTDIRSGNQNLFVKPNWTSWV